MDASKWAVVDNTRKSSIEVDIDGLNLEREALEVIQ